MKKFRVAVTLLLLGAVVTPLRASATAACASSGSTAGEWPSYGQNLSNWRFQPDESSIGAANVAQLASAWAFSVTKAGGAGGEQSTPAIADGCLFVTTSSGSVFAVNADTGETVWSTEVTRTSAGPAAAGAAIFSPSVSDGRVYVLGDDPGQAGKPLAAALDEQTGKLIWQTDLIDVYAGIFDAASAVVADGMFFAATTSGDTGTGPTAAPPFWILDAATGKILKETRPIPLQETLKGYGGGGIWSTAAVDEQTKFLYVGTANPYSRRKEHPYTNAILKVDFDPSRPTFGDVVGYYKGNVDSDPALVNTPQCQYLGDIPGAAYSLFCGQYDMDMAASPQLFTDSSGRKLVGELQKSGVYHVADATTMQPVWHARVSAWYAAGGNSATAAYDGHAIYINTDQGLVTALNKDNGDVLWTASYGDPGGKYEPMTVANGVVYALNHNGSLHAFDAATGQLLLTLPLDNGAGLSCTGTSGAGVAVAQNTLYVGCDSASDGAGAVFALRVPSL